MLLSCAANHRESLTNSSPEAAVIRDTEAKDVRGLSSMGVEE